MNFIDFLSREANKLVKENTTEFYKLAFIQLII